MLYDALIANASLAKVLAGLPVYDLGDVEPALKDNNASDWAKEKVSGRNLAPPVNLLYAEYKWKDAGPGGMDAWSIGVVIQEVPRASVEAMATGSQGNIQVPPGERRFFKVDQFERLDASREREEDKEGRKMPMGVPLHNLMTWTFSFQWGTNARIQAFFSKEANETGKAPTPFGLQRTRTINQDNYFPVGCPWVPFAIFGLSREGAVTFKTVAGRQVLERSSSEA